MRRWIFLLVAGFAVACDGGPPRLYDDDTGPSGSHDSQTDDSGTAFNQDGDPALLDELDENIDDIELHKTEHTADLTGAANIDAALALIDDFQVTISADRQATESTLEDIRTSCIGDPDTGDTGWDAWAQEKNGEIDAAISLVVGLEDDVIQYNIQSTGFTDLGQALAADKVLQTEFDAAVSELRQIHSDWVSDGFCEDQDEPGG